MATSVHGVTPRRLRCAAAQTIAAAAVVGVLGVFAAGCVAPDTFSSSTLPPMPSVGVESPQGPGDTTARPALDITPRSPEIVGDTCEIGAAPDLGTPPVITYVAGGSLFQLSADAASARCLAAIKSTDLQPMLWSPFADRLLINPSALYDAAGRHKTNFAVEQKGIAWSMDGTMLLAPAGDGSLNRRSVGVSNSRVRLGTIAVARAAVFHPDAATVVAGGENDNGRAVLAMSDVRGRNARELVRFGDGVKISAVNVSASGERIAVGLGGTLNAVRIVELPTLDVRTVIEADVPIVAVMQLDDVVVAEVGSCAGSTSVRINNGSLTIDLNAGDPFVGRSNQPVGFLNGLLLVISRPSGCTAPGDLWAVNPIDPTIPELLVSGVENAALRAAPNFPAGLPEGIPAEPVDG